MTIESSFDLQLTGITKAYPGVVALDDVSLHVHAGEVIGLIGENGAGKSTLMKVLGGLIAPTKGTITIDGVQRPRLDIQQSFDAGISFVHQELNPFDNLNVAANLRLGREIRGGPFRLIDEAAMDAAVQPILNKVGATFGPRDNVANLSLAERQIMEIAKALTLNARLVIMDEPTSSLTLSETNTLLGVIADLKASGISVLFISHRLNEVEQCADRVVALRDGKVAGHLSRDEINHDSMIRLMIGRELMVQNVTRAAAPGDAVLEIEGVSTSAFPHTRTDLSVRAGEITGLAGLVGAGRTELARAVFGIDAPASGIIKLAGRQLGRHRPADAISRGLCLVPEDRKDAGLILDFPICENISLPDLAHLNSNGLVDERAELARAEAQRQSLSIKTQNVKEAAANMSGGNQQKIVLGKWLAMKPRVIIFDEPTRGVDVGAKAEIYRLMRDLADSGVAILMISSDMEEVIGVSDRIAVMRRGEISGILEPSEFSEQNVLTLAVG